MPTGIPATFRRMDWQEMTALAVVAATAGAFLVAAWKNSSVGAPSTSGGCGSCGGHGSLRGSKAALVVHSKRGERPRVLIKER